MKKKHTKTVVLEINDLEKEYLLILARLKLVQYGHSDAVVLGKGPSRQLPN